MKKLFIIMVVFFVAPQSYAQDKGSSFANIQKDLLFLTQLDKPRNYKNLASLNKVASYIKNEFSKVCDSVGFQTYQVQGKEYKNVIGSIGLHHSERIVIGAHYDVYGNSEGADDNASGVVGLLELARLLSKQKLNYRIDFVAYTLEEPPFFRTTNMGSYVHAKYLNDYKINVKGMICLESIGYFNDKHNSQEYPIKEMSSVYGTKGNFITVVQNEKGERFSAKISDLMIKQQLIETKPFVGSSLLPGVDFSDHLNYWKFNFEAVMITNTAFYRNKHYHTKGDRLKTLDIEKISLVVQQLQKVISSL